MPDEMFARFQQIDLIKIAGEVLERRDVKHQYNQLNRDQMWDGKDSNGKDLAPTYLQDPYFKGNEKRARGYMEWKQRITPNPRRRPEVPNLMINGHYYNSIDYQIQGVFILHTNTWSEGIDIDRKYHFVRGLSPLSREEFWRRVMHDELIAEIAFITKTF